MFKISEKYNKKVYDGIRLKMLNIINNNKTLWKLFEFSRKCAMAITKTNYIINSRPRSWSTYNYSIYTIAFETTNKICLIIVNMVIWRFILFMFYFNIKYVQKNKNYYKIIMVFSIVVLANRMNRNVQICISFFFFTAYL